MIPYGGKWLHFICIHRKEDLYSFLKDAFSMDDEKHYEMLIRIGQEKAPQTCIDISVDRAENLLAKDPNGS